MDPSVSDEKNALLALCQTIAVFGRVEVPNDLQTAYAGAKGFVKHRPKTQETQDLKGIITNIQRSKEGHRVNVTMDTDDWEIVSVRFENNQNNNGLGNDLTEIADLALPYMTLLVTAVTPSSSTENAFSTTFNSLIVLEPDYLIEVKELAECCQNKGYNDGLFLASRFDKSSANEPMLIGITAGNILDGVVTEGSTWHG